VETAQVRGGGGSWKGYSDDAGPEIRTRPENIMAGRLTTALMAPFTLAIASGSLVRAHEGHEHKVMGPTLMSCAFIACLCFVTFVSFVT